MFLPATSAMMARFILLPGSNSSKSGPSRIIAWSSTSWEMCIRDRIYPDEWLEMVNTYLNPFEEEITLDDVSILTEDDNGTIYSTNDYYADDPGWGNYY